MVSDGAQEGSIHSLFPVDGNQQRRKEQEIRGKRKEDRVVSKNTNELKTCSRGRFGLEVSTRDWPTGARILGHERADGAAIGRTVWRSNRAIILICRSSNTPA